ncbi:hypothetical protein ACLPHM_05875 [Paenalcaligenes sp. Me131]|uniref:hypothetical protein n=1 Tax=Paenalcaligenes sp. Me131 TaxID=3392636 RepID=UPI003D2AC20C
MLRLIELIGDELISLEEAVAQVKADGDIEEENTHIEKVLIPGARGIAEEITGSILRKGIYEETIVSGQSLSKGGITKIESVLSGGVPVPFQHRRVAKRSVIVTDRASSTALLEVRFEAGLDRDTCPAQLRSWLLMVIGFMYKDRDLTSKDTKIRNLDFLLSSFTVPSGF